MKLKYLGTAAAEGWPALFCKCESCERARKFGGKNIRTRSQSIIDNRLLIDFGPDTYLHVLQHHMPLEDIHHVLVTHSHIDHLYPSDLINLAEPYAHGVTEPMTIYSTPGTGEKIRLVLKAEDDSDNLPERMIFKEVTEFVPFKVMDYTVTPLLAKHMVHEKCFIYLITDPDGKTLLYANDTAWFPEETWKYLESRHLDAVSLDCTMVFEPDCLTHMGFESNIKAKNKLLAMGSADAHTIFVVNHFSHNGLASHEEIETRAGKEGFLTAYDGFEITI